jgi:hypothetical protein
LRKPSPEVLELRRSYILHIEYDEENDGSCGADKMNYEEDHGKIISHLFGNSVH